MDRVVKTFQNGETWRIVTPVMLFILSTMTALSMWILSDVKASVTKNTDLLITHIANPDYHYNAITKIISNNRRLDKVEKKLDL